MARARAGCPDGGALHFWPAGLGIAIYFVGLSIGGWLQGVAMLDAARPFMESVTLTVPYLQVRSWGGSLMTLGHFVFVSHFLAMALRFGPHRIGVVQALQVLDQIHRIRGKPPPPCRPVRPPAAG